MKIFTNGRPVIYGLITALATITCTTFAHYAELWFIGYLVGVVFAVVSAILISIVDN